MYNYFFGQNFVWKASTSFGNRRQQECFGVARKNSALHKVNEKVSLIKQNLLSGTKIEEDTLIIANLPYVPKYLYNGLDKSVKDYEPKSYCWRN